MAKASSIPLTHKGPWNGLNVAVDPTELPPGSAVRCHNVMLSEHRVRPRAPWRRIAHESVWDGSQKIGCVPLSMIEVRLPFPGDPNSYRDYMFIKGIRGANQAGGFSDPGTPVLISIHMDGAFYHRADLVVANGLTYHPADFVITNGWVFCLDGGDVIYKTKGTAQTTFRAGIVAPPSGYLEKLYDVSPSDNPIPIEHFAYAFTYYDKDNDVESNQDGSDITTHSPFRWPRDDLHGEITFRVGPLGATMEGVNITHLRLYRKNEERSQVGFRLIAEEPVLSPGSSTYLLDDFGTEEDIRLSDLVTGPWAPTRNYPMTGGTVGALYKDRIYFHRRLHGEPGRVRFTPIGKPDYMHDEDFVRCAGDTDDRVSGLKEYGGQLVIGKPNAIWGHGGVEGGHTNKTAATGALPIQGNASTQKSKAAVGPINGFGNGFLVAGEPARLWFGSAEGFGFFDGSTAIMVSRAIKPLWRSFVSAGDRVQIAQGVVFAGGPTLSYAVDHQNGVIIIASLGMGKILDGGLAQYESAPEALAFHWAVPGWGWSTLAPNNVVSDLNQDDGRIRCVTSGALQQANVGARGTIIPAQVMQLIEYFIGTDVESLLSAVFDPLEEADFPREVGNDRFLPDAKTRPAPMVDFEFRTGRLEPYPGQKTHFYRCRHLFTSSPRAGSAFFGYSLNGGPDVLVSRSLRVLDGEDKPRSFLQSVRREGRDLQIVFKWNPDWSQGWDYQSGFAGYELAVEPTGEF